MVKKVIALSLLLMMLLSSCSRYEQRNEVSDDKEPVEDTDLAEITLDENPTTGYVWTYSLEPKGIVKVVKDGYRPIGDPDADGAGGEHIWYIKGLKEGTATMTFLLSFEGDEEEISGDPVVYEITVGSDREIVLSEASRLPNGHNQTNSPEPSDEPVGDPVSAIETELKSAIPGTEFTIELPNMDIVIRSDDIGEADFYTLVHQVMDILSNHPLNQDYYLDIEIWGLSDIAQISYNSLSNAIDAFDQNAESIMEQADYIYLEGIEDYNKVFNDNKPYLTEDQALQRMMKQQSSFIAQVSEDDRDNIEDGSYFTHYYSQYIDNKLLYCFSSDDVRYGYGYYVHAISGAIVEIFDDQYVPVKACDEALKIAALEMLKGSEPDVRDDRLIFIYKPAEDTVMLLLPGYDTVEELGVYYYKYTLDDDGYHFEPYIPLGVGA